MIAQQAEAAHVPIVGDICNGRLHQNLHANLRCSRPALADRGCAKSSKRTHGASSKLNDVTRSRAFGIAAAIFYILLWASAYVPSKIGVLDSSPMWFLVTRFAVSGTIALGIALALGARL